MMGLLTKKRQDIDDDYLTAGCVSGIILVIQSLLSLDTKTFTVFLEYKNLKEWLCDILFPSDNQFYQKEVTSQLYQIVRYIKDKKYKDYILSTILKELLEILSPEYILYSYYIHLLCSILYNFKHNSLLDLSNDNSEDDEDNSDDDDIKLDDVKLTMNRRYSKDLYNLDIKQLHTKIYNYIISDKHLNGYILLLRYLYFVYIYIYYVSFLFIGITRINLYR